MITRCVSLAASVCVCAGLAAGLNGWSPAVSQSGTPAQPGTPSKQPGPKQPNPTPAQDPAPDPNRPDRDQPRAPDPDDRDRDRDDRDRREPRDTRDTRDPRDARDPRDGDLPRTPGVPPGALPRARSERPFAFQTPEMEAQFRESTRRLSAMESRMQRSNEELLERLGQARALSGERQTTALFDVIQQLLRDNAEMQRYLVTSRTAWTGDLGDETSNPDQDRYDQPVAPGAPVDPNRPDRTPRR